MASMCETLLSRFETHSDDPAAIGPDERWLSVAAGGCLAGYGLSRLRLGALAALGTGAYLVYRGATGRCPLRAKVVYGCQAAEGESRRASVGPPNAGPWERDAAHAATAAPACPEAPVAQRSLDDVDEADEAMMESFPASDPPSYTGKATPGVRIE